MIWKFFPNPIVCLDGDESGQKAALRIAEKLFPLINEENKIKDIENTKNELSNDSEIKNFLDEFDGEIEVVTKIKN